MNPDSSRKEPSVWQSRGLAVLATLAVVGLLMAFHQVVRGAVVRGESMRKANATLAEATWRCRAQRAPDLREACRQELAPQATLQYATVAGLGN